LFGGLVHVVAAPGAEVHADRGEPDLSAALAPGPGESVKPRRSRLLPLVSWAHLRLAPRMRGIPANSGWPGTHGPVAVAAIGAGLRPSAPRAVRGGPPLRGPARAANVRPQEAAPAPGRRGPDRPGA